MVESLKVSCCFSSWVFSGFRIIFTISLRFSVIFDAVSILADATGNVSFATLPDNNRTFYLGVSQTLRQPEFSRDPMRASQVMEVLEDNDQFIGTLRELDIDNEIKIYIGQENLLSQIQSCAMIVTQYKVGNYQGYLGILGPTRMKYPFNHAMLKNVRDVMYG